MRNGSDLKQLVLLLEKAVQLSAEFSGGHSPNFLSAEEFHATLAGAVQRIKENHMTELEKIYTWFLPASAWDDFVDIDGLDLGNEISELVTKLVSK